MHGVGTSVDGNPPLDRQWMRKQWDLQKRILERMRSLGVVAVLPAFQGNVPPPLVELYPTANISTQGTGRHWAAWLDALDPLFGRIGDSFMKQLIQDFGTDHW
jgi:alpha-N-acetylglucosaminidase